VTLVAAMEHEDAAAWRGMVGQHRESLEELTAAADGVIAVTLRDDPGRPGAGLALLMFAAELASAVRPDEYRGELPSGLVAACEQTVTAAALAAAACLSGFAEVMEALAALVG
jgi:phage tail sheath gpL-like